MLFVVYAHSYQNYCMKYVSKRVMPRMWPLC